MDNTVVNIVKNDSTNIVTFRFKKEANLYKVIRDYLSSVFPTEDKEQTEFVVPREDVIIFSDHSPEDIRKQFTLSTYAFLKKLFLDIGKHCMYLQETSGLYLSELQLNHIVYIKDTFVILPPDEVISEKSDDSQWKNDLANVILSFIDIQKLNGTSLYYAILRCQERIDPIFIYV
jgi:hypothetical protein